jgi:hypothetical protein
MIHEGPVPRRLTRPVEHSASTGRAAFTTFALGVTAGVIGWLLAGRPGLMVMPTGI